MNYIAHSMSADPFLQTLQRFTKRQGLPYKIYFVNGSNFVGINREHLCWNHGLMHGTLEDKKSRSLAFSGTAHHSSRWGMGTFDQVRPEVSAVVGQSTNSQRLNLKYSEKNTKQPSISISRLQRIRPFDFDF